MLILHVLDKFARVFLSMQAVYAYVLLSLHAFY